MKTVYARKYRQPKTVSQPKTAQSLLNGESQSSGSRAAQAIAPATTYGLHGPARAGVVGEDPHQRIRDGVEQPRDAHRPAEQHGFTASPML